jgi:molybdate transport system permease protein
MWVLTPAEWQAFTLSLQVALISVLWDLPLAILLAFTLTRRKFAGAALATAVMTLPMMVRAMRISLEHVDPGLEDAARTLGAGPIDRFLSVTLPLMLPGVLAGSITAFAAGLGEFGAVITFVSSIPGQTRTLPLALYAALQMPDGGQSAARLAALSIGLGFAGLVLAQYLSRRVARTLGR